VAREAGRCQGVKNAVKDFVKLLYTGKKQIFTELGYRKIVVQWGSAMSMGLESGNKVSAHWLLRLFGGFELAVHVSGERLVVPGKRERVLLAYLALSPNGRQPRRRLVNLLWGEAGDESALDNLRTCIFNLRKALGDSEHRIIASDGKDIVLDAAAFKVDALEFRRLAVQSGLSDLEAAANLYRGEFLEGLGIESEEFEAWRRGEAMRCRDQTLDILVRLMSQLAGAGETARAIETGLQVLRLDPLHEVATRGVMRMYGETGRRATAIQLYGALEEALRKELNIEPEAETRTVFAEVSRGDGPIPRANGSDAAEGELPSGSMLDASITDRPGVIPPQTQSTFRLRSRVAVMGGISAVAAIVLMSYGGYALLFHRQGIDVERLASASEASAISIAVLPLVNLSGDADQEFFSDGVTEEIGTALARIPDVKVLARTSAFQFKGENRDIQNIGRQLHATHLIEGSVRKDGDRVRIVAQLIDAKTGVRLSSESYDRQLGEIFDTQEEIARNVVGALMAPLGLAPGVRLVSYRPADEVTYELFLRGRAAFRARKPEALQYLEQVVARDPNFAPGWVYYGEANFFKISNEELEKVARRAIALAPNYSGGYWLLASVTAQGTGNFPLAIDFVKEALARDPDNPEALNTYSNWLRTLGYLREALQIRERLHLLEPLIPVYNKLLAETTAANGMTETAVRDWLDVRGSSGIGQEFLAPAQAQLGHLTEAIDALSGPPPDPTSTTPSNSTRDPRQSYAHPLVEAAVQVLRATANKTALPPRLPDFYSELNFVYAYTPKPERMLDWPEKAVKERKGAWPQVVRTIWWPVPSAVRKTERFKRLVRDAGLVDYWRARGWPDLCHPVGTDDFICD